MGNMVSGSEMKPVLEMMASEFLMASRRCEIATLEALLSMGRLVAAVSNLIHAVQRERGASNLYLGSRGAEFGEQLGVLVENTDLELERLTGIWAATAATTATGTDRTRLCSRLAHASHALAGLGDLRDRVREMRMTPLEGVDAYTELVRVLLAIVFEAADAAVDPRISVVLVAFFNFMEGKEFAGQERATGAGALATGGIDEATRNRILRVIAEQERCFEVFENFADAETLAEWRACLSGAEQNEMERLRRIACSAGRDAQMNPEFGRAWYECATRRIDAMKVIEDRQAGYLQSLSEEKLRAASEGMQSAHFTIPKDDAMGSGFVLYCRSDDFAAVGGVATATGGPRLGKSLLEMLQIQTQRLQKLDEELSKAKEALEDRKIIEKAKGMLMMHRKVCEQEAHKMLRDLSMKQGCRMAEVAGQLVAMETVWK